MAEDLALFGGARHGRGMLRRTPNALAFVLSLVASAAAGCAEAPPVVQAPKTQEAPAQAAPGSAEAAVPPGHLARADVEGVLQKGPPWLLRRITMEEVIREGKFVGWRILSLSLPAAWKVDLRPGDIVKTVNGLALERPDDFFAAWMQLHSAVELRLTCEREGKAHEVAMPIEGPSKAASALAQMEAEPPPPPRRSRWQTIVIEGDDGAPPAEPQD